MGEERGKMRGNKEAARDREGRQEGEREAVIGA
jgi:hypothetical protein